MGDSKLKILRILEILKETDEKHPLTANQIGEKLQDMGIQAERKSICRDINLLSEEGFDIILHDDNKRGYFMGNRYFEEWEVKILVDAVISSRFLSERHAKIIRDKLLAHLSPSNREFIKSITPFEAKTHHEDIRVKLFIDHIMQAIKDNKKIAIDYTTRNINLERCLRREEKYILNPYALVWDNNLYYLICNTDKYDNLSYYRLDRMENLDILKDNRKPLRQILGDSPEAKLRDFVETSINRRGGDPIRITVEVPETMVDDLYDVFGANIVIIPKKTKDDVEERRCEVTFSAPDNDGLYYWLLQRGANLKVMEPKTVRNKLIERVKELNELYGIM